MPKHFGFGQKGLKMKKLFVMCLTLAGMIVFTGCSESSESPRDVAVKWGNALVAGDIKTADKYSTEKTQSLNKMMLVMISEKEVKDEITGDIKKWKNGKEKIDGDMATVFEKDPKDKSAVTLKKVNGKWKVDVQKPNGTDPDNK